MIHTTKTNTNCNFMLDDNVKPWKSFSFACKVELPNDIKADLTCEQMLTECIKRVSTGINDLELRQDINFKAYVNACRLVGRFFDETILSSHLDIRDKVADKISQIVPADETEAHIDLSLSIADCNFRLGFFGLAFDYVQERFANKTGGFCNLRPYASGSLKHLIEVLVKSNGYLNGANSNYVKQSCLNEKDAEFYNKNFMFIPPFQVSPWSHEQARFLNIIAGQNLINCLLLAGLNSRCTDKKFFDKFVSEWKSSKKISDETFRAVYLQFVDPTKEQDEKDLIKRVNQEVLCQVFANRANLMNDLFVSFFDRKYDKKRLETESFGYDVFDYSAVCSQLVEIADEMLQGIDGMKNWVEHFDTTDDESRVEHPLSADYSDLVVENMHFGVKPTEQEDSN